MDKETKNFPTFLENISKERRLKDRAGIVERELYENSHNIIMKFAKKQGENRFYWITEPVKIKKEGTNEAFQVQLITQSLDDKNLLLPPDGIGILVGIIGVGEKRKIRLMKNEYTNFFN